MNMRNMDDVLPYILPYAPGCAEPVAVQHLRDAAVRFCERTRIWRQIDSFTSSGNDPEVLALPVDAELFEIEWCSFNGRKLEAVRPQYDNYPLSNGATEPKYFTQVNPSSISIQPPAIGELKISMFLKPSMTAQELPAFLVADFARVLADGALSAILLLPNQPFTNPQLASVFEAKFSTALDRNFAYHMRGQQRAARRTKPVNF